MQAQRLHQALTKEINLGYWLHLPADYSATRQYPLLLFLHGRGESGEDLEALKKHGPPKILAQDPTFAPLAPFIVAAPQCPWRTWWPEQRDALLLLLDDLQANYAVDSQRVYLTGLSMGGFGSWYLGSMHPERFAAVAPICGGGYWVHGFPDTVAALKDTPVWAFHGAKDPIVPLAASQQLVDALQGFGGNVRFTIYPEADHDSWTETYHNPAFYAWLLEQRAR